MEAEFALAVQAGTTDQSLDRRAQARAKTLAYLPHLRSAATTAKQFERLNKMGDCASLITEFAPADPAGAPYLVSSYCRSRLCLVCNRIQTGRYIERYQPILASFDRPQFVTLTVPNVPGPELRGQVRAMLRTFRQVQDALRKSRRGSRLMAGLRKVECTYNRHRDDYHPHIHAVVADEGQAFDLLAGWLQRQPAAVRQAQDMRDADPKDLRELFKYFTKLVTGTKEMQPAAVLHMSEALAGMRLVEAFGAARGQVQHESQEDATPWLSRIRPGSEHYYEWAEEDAHWVHVATRMHIRSRVAIRQLFDVQGRAIARAETNVSASATPAPPSQGCLPLRASANWSPTTASAQTSST